MPFAAGEVIAERYRLQKRLRINHARETWLIHDLKQDSLWVLKLLYFGGDTQWQDLKLLEREAQTLQSLQHPSIPCYGTAFWIERLEGHYFCLLQQYIAGTTLAEQVQQGVRYNPNELERLATSMLSILEYIHGQSPPVVHRDIKPSNILVSEDGTFYLIDFGAVQAQVSGRGTMTVVGTFGYMPPEQFMAQSVPASDLYGLGATLVHLASGVDPADLPREGLRMQFAGRVHLDTGWQLWLERLVEPELEWRWGGAAEALHGLAERYQLAESREHAHSSPAAKEQNRLAYWQSVEIGLYIIVVVFSLPLATILHTLFLRGNHNAAIFFTVWLATLVMLVCLLTPLLLMRGPSIDHRKGES